jgi:hypothetical protein
LFGAGALPILERLADQRRRIRRVATPAMPRSTNAIHDEAGTGTAANS